MAVDQPASKNHGYEIAAWGTFPLRGSGIGLSVIDAWGKAAVSMMLKRCSQLTEESIRERLDTPQGRQMSKWN
jgi:hypothetical protein